MFFKNTTSDNAFNSLLISALGDGVRNTGQLPNQSQIESAMEGILKKRNEKLSQAQINSIRACASLLELESISTSLLPLVKKFNTEIPRGEMTSYEEIKNKLERNGVLMIENQNVRDMLSRSGIKF